MRISDWSSDVCSSDLPLDCRLAGIGRAGDAIIIFDHLKIGIIIIEGREVCPKPPVEEGRFQAHIIATNTLRKQGSPVAQLETARFEPAGWRWRAAERGVGKGGGSACSSRGRQENGE